MKSFTPLIIGLESESLSSEEKAFFKKFNPWGVILFKRNCLNPTKTKYLINKIKEINGDNYPILIDQEGGRVSRINYTEFPKCPPAKYFGEIIEKNKSLGLEILKNNIILLSLSLKRLGININTLPVLDIPDKGESGIIGDRAFSNKKEIVSLAGGELIETMKACGIAPVIKHIPGHGKASVDSHVGMPVIESELIELHQSDFVPFKNNAANYLGMTAHILYKNIDPNQIATFSKSLIKKTIREEIGFKGLLMTDDISMKAIKLNPEDAADKALAAGCDLVLHCNGKINEMNRIADKINSKYELITSSKELENIFNNEINISLREAELKFNESLNQADLI